MDAGLTGGAVSQTAHVAEKLTLEHPQLLCCRTDTENRDKSTGYFVQWK